MNSFCYRPLVRAMGDIERLDRAFAALACEQTALRLRLGQLLEVMGRGAVFDLGFSSLGAYAVERCECSVRWAEGARCMARRLEALPELRRAMVVGEISWSMGELLARVASPADEARWVELAASRTVRQVRAMVADVVAGRAGAGSSGAGALAAGPDEGSAAREEAGTASEPDEALDSLHDDSDDVCTLTCTVDREDAWLFEATRCLLDHLGTHGSVAQMEALLAEGQGTLLGSLPPGTLDLDGVQAREWAQQRGMQEVRRWRDQAEACCERGLLDELRAARAASSAEAARRLPVAVEVLLGLGPLENASCTVLDEQVRAVATALARHELELSSLALRFHRAGGWRRLGYATETQYARERLGLSRSSLQARRALALRLEKLPGIAAALGAARIGVEAALQLVRIATPKTEGAWLERARKRTIKHLREEVAAALVTVRLAGESDCLPPEDAEMAAFESLERAVVSGALGQSSAARNAGAARPSVSSAARDEAERASAARRAWWIMLGSLASWLEGAVQVSAVRPSATPSTRAHSSAGRVTLRMRMSRETYVWWRALEDQARRWLPVGVSWLRFLCASVWHAWRHLLGADVAYGQIHVRDRFRCTSPVCNRRDVTPHHIVFRSAGGGDEPSNITSPCTWCHLFGVHGGRIRVLGTADRMRWELGPEDAPCVVVHGRERCVA